MPCSSVVAVVPRRRQHIKGAGGRRIKRHYDKQLRDGEADGSGGKRKRTGEAAAAVRAVRLFGLFGCSAVRAVRAVRLFGRRRLSSPAWPAASVAKPPPKQETAAAGSSSFLFLVLLFLRLSPIGGSGEGKIHRCDGCVGGCAGRSSAARALLPRMASGERSEAPTAKKLLFSLFVFVLCAIYY